MIVRMTTEIERLAREAADPVEAGQKMRQVYFTQVKLTNRQLTVDLLRKLYEREIGTHEVEQLAKKVIKGESRRNPKIVQNLIMFTRLFHISKWQHNRRLGRIPGWQKLRGSTGGTRRKVWTRTKILSPNIRYFVAN